MPDRGGGSGKAGIRYEGLWTAHCMLDVLAGRASSIQLEPFDVDGVEFVLRAGRRREYHQVKRQQTKAGWTLSSLWGVLEAFGEHLAGAGTQCVFVSTHSATTLQELSEQAALLQRFGDFMTRVARSKELARDFELLRRLWGRDERSTWSALRRLQLHAISESPLREKTLERARDAFFDADGGVRVLAELASELFHQRLTRARLQRELRERGVALRVRAADDVRSASLATPGMVPGRPRSFVGRSGEVGAVRAKLAGVGPAGAAGVVVWGWPGVGKSTFAAWLAHDRRLRAAFPDGVAWVALGRDPNVPEALRRQAEGLGLPYPSGVDDPESIARRLIAAAASRRCLFILDDLWDAALLEAVSIAGPVSATLVTTRAPAVADELDGLEAVRLGELDAAGSRKLLRTIVPEVVDAMPAEIDRVIESADGLPLSLKVAGRLIRAQARRGGDVHGVVGELGAGVGILDARPPADRVDSEGEMPPTVRHIIARSVDSLGEMERACFADLAHVPDDPATFDAGLLGHLWQLDDPRPVIAQLVDLGLLEHVGGGRFRMHALLQLYAKSARG